MSNYPAGAEHDPFAPYNVKEKVFKFDINVKGLYYHEYFGTLDYEEVQSIIRGRIQAAVDQVLDQGDIDSVLVDVSVS